MIYEVELIMNAIKLILLITPVIYVMANFESDFEKKYKGKWFACISYIMCL